MEINNKLSANNNKNIHGAYAIEIYKQLLLVLLTQELRMLDYNLSVLEYYFLLL